MMSTPDQPKGRGASDGRDGAVAEPLGQFATRQRMIDCWADGQLPLADQRRLLAYCVEHPDVWRELSLGLVSAQAWRDALTDDPGPTWVVEQRVGPAMIGQYAAQRSRSTWAALLVAAAALLPLGWWCGYTAAYRQTQQISRRDDLRGAEDGAKNEANQKHVEPSQEQRTRATPVDVVGQGRAVSLPARQIRSTAELSAVAHLASPPDEWLDRAQRSGYDVRVRTDLWPARDPAGQTYWVPISQTQLRSPEIWNQ